MKSDLDKRGSHEIDHGRFLALNGAEDIWGWNSPAGKVRAKRRMKLISSNASLSKGVTALELGCGTGNFTEKFALSGASITGLDISEDLLAIARERSYPQGNVNYINGRFEDCDLHPGYDAIIGSSVLHHLQMEVAVSRIYSLLKPGGTMCFAEPNMLNPQVALQKNIPWLKAKLGDSPYETAIIRWHFAELLRSTGFIEIQITPFDWLHPATPKFLIDIVSTIGKTLEKIPFIKELSGSVIIRAKKPS